MKMINFTFWQDNWVSFLSDNMCGGWDIVYYYGVDDVMVLSRMILSMYMLDDNRTVVFLMVVLIPV